jgi:hypothetical protein
MKCSLLLKSYAQYHYVCASVQNVSTETACVDFVQNLHSVNTCCPSSLFKIVEDSSDVELLYKNLTTRDRMSSFFLETSFPGIQTQKSPRI